MAIFLPLQGFVIALIFLRPVYQLWRELNPRASWTWITWKSMGGEKPRQFLALPTNSQRAQVESPKGHEIEGVEGLVVAPPEANPNT